MDNHVFSGSFSIVLIEILTRKTKTKTENILWVKFEWKNALKKKGRVKIDHWEIGTKIVASIFKKKIQ